MVKQKNKSNAEYIFNFEDDNYLFPPNEISSKNWSDYEVPMAWSVNDEILFKFFVPKKSGLYALYSSNPKIINIDNFEILPNFGDFWNGKNFESKNQNPPISEKILDIQPFDDSFNYLIPFAFLINDEVSYIVRVKKYTPFWYIFDNDPKIINLLETDERFQNINFIGPEAVWIRNEFNTLFQMENISLKFKLNEKKLSKKEQEEAVKIDGFNSSWSKNYSLENPENQNLQWVQIEREKLKND
jgi:hypothetical protein